MSGVLVWIIIVIIIVAKLKQAGIGENSNKNRNRVKPSQNVYRQTVSMPKRPVNGQTVNMAQRTANGQTVNMPNRPANEQTYYERRESQEALKSRLQQKYTTKSAQQMSGMVGKSSGEQAVPESMQMSRNVQRASQTVIQDEKDILHRATKNVAEFEQEDMLEKTDFMKQVDDLMIMGYTGKLSFERDFVAEGVDMLNQFEFLQTDAFNLNFSGENI